MTHDEIKSLLIAHGVDWNATIQCPENLIEDPHYYDGESVWTISKDPNLNGWETDCGINGYGLQKESAEFFSELPKIVEQLLKEIEELKKQVSVEKNEIKTKVRNRWVDEGNNEKIQFSMPSKHVECWHELVYEPILRLSDPPQRKWICKKCGHNGSVLYDYKNYNDDYDTIKKMWEDE